MPSPFVPSHKRKFTANKVFTDREKPTTLFLRAFDPPPEPDAHRVLVFYGVGGEGKTALVRHLLALLEKEYAGRAGWAAVNLEDAAMRRPAEALLSVRLQLRRTAGLSFPAFDTAFAHWFGRTYPGASIRQRHPELFRQPSELAADAVSLGGELRDDVLKGMEDILADVAREVPGLGLIWKYGHRFHARFREWWERRGKEVLRGVETLQPDQLLDRLPSFLGADLADGIASMPARGRRPLAIVGDTLEAFHRGEAQKGGGGFAFRNDRWLRELVKESPGVLFVLLGRDRLRWADIEPEWAQVLDQHRLGALKPADAERYLRAVPVAEPEVRARMVEGAKGLPFYLDLQVDLYESLLNQGRAPEPAQFGGSEPEILERFLDHLGGAATRALAVLAHGRRLDEDLWLHLGREFLGGLPPFAFGGLKGFSFVEELEGGWLGLHALMREALRARTAAGEPVLHERVHRCLFAWWDERCRPADLRSVTTAHELALAEAAYHRAYFDQASFGDWAYERGMPFAMAARYSLTHNLWEKALAMEEAALPHDHRRIARTLVALGGVLQRTAQLAASLAHHERALEILKQATPRDVAKIAMVKRNIGNIMAHQGDLASSLNCLREAVKILEVLPQPDPGELAGTLCNLGTTLTRRKRWHEATRYLEQALEIQERELGLYHVDIAITLNNLGNALTGKRKYRAALGHQVRALEIQEREYGPDHPQCAISLNNIGDILRQMGKPRKAMGYLQKALAIKRDRLGPDHTSVAVTLNAIGDVQALQNDWSGARTSQMEALGIQERTLNPYHRDLAKTLFKLTKLEAQVNHQVIADAYRARAREILRRSRAAAHE